MKPSVLKSGFSLIEVTLALGIVTFALIAILGLVPVGENMSRTSINQTRAAEIAQVVFDTLRSHPFEEVRLPAISESLDLRADIPQNRLYANYEGQLAAARSADTAFAVDVAFNRTAAATGVALRSDGSSSATRVSIRVTWGEGVRSGTVPAATRDEARYATIIRRY